MHNSLCRRTLEYADASRRSRRCSRQTVSGATKVVEITREGGELYMIPTRTGLTIRRVKPKISGSCSRRSSIFSTPQN